MKYIGENLTLEDPFGSLQGISSSPEPILSPNTGIYINTEQEVMLPLYESNTSNNTISSNSTTTTASSLSVTLPSENQGSSSNTNNSNLGFFLGGLGMGSGSSSGASENNVASGVKKETLLDKWKKLSDLKKGLIVLVVATGTYYGYKQLKN